MRSFLEGRAVETFLGDTLLLLPNLQWRRNVKGISGRRVADTLLAGTLASTEIDVKRTLEEKSWEMV